MKVAPVAALERTQTGGLLTDDEAGSAKQGHGEFSRLKNEKGRREAPWSLLPGTVREEPDTRLWT
jgi:hypothetical protein